ncbi:tetratricopeptide repeat protein [Parasphingorhabdus marina]|uniref:tetratricopeptide repeat protein n=1 Tax=Parasphingorhabdus marina TaxID=394732 RepID=UPI0009416B46|nr:tetratricopeptide repeat protein [Parasphingorhabdus marina]
MLATSGQPVLAKRTENAAALSRFAEARLAELSEDNDTAVEIYREKLKAQPQNLLIARKAFAKAIETGDFDLALSAVRIIDANGSIDAEMPLVLFADAFESRDWRRAGVALKRLEELGNFGFLSPPLQAWTNLAVNRKSPLDLKAVKDNRTARYYLQEQTILHLLARKEHARVRPLIDEIVEQNEARMAPVRVIAARHFLSVGMVDYARAILRFSGTSTESRLLNQIENGTARRNARAVNFEAGAAFTLQRLANDLGSQQAPFLALVSAQMADRIDEDTDYGHLVLARRYSDAGATELAFDEFAEIGPDSPYRLIALNANLAGLIEQDKFNLAISLVQDAIADDPDYPQLHLLKGQVLQMDQSYMEAAAAFKQAVTLAEQQGAKRSVLANYWLSLGGAQEQAGIWPQGLESLKKANELQPRSPTILNYLGYAQLERRENTEEAVAAIKEAFELRSTSPAITDSLGWAYFLTGEHEKAVKYLERALAGEPQDPTINEHLGDAYWTVGRKYEARYAWQSAKLFADKEDQDRLAKKIDLGLMAELVSP